MSKSSSRWEKLLLPLFAATFTVISAFAETRTYRVDFGVESSPIASGFEAAEAITLQGLDSPNFSLTDTAGQNPIKLQFSGVIGGYSLGDLKAPLTTDGIYTFNTNVGADSEEAITRAPLEVAFTISGLPIGSKVTMHGVAAWNGDVRAAFVSLGNSGQVDLAGSSEPPIDSNSQESFVQVATEQEVKADGTISGTFSNSDGFVTRPEGQWGGMILMVETP